MRKKLFCLLIAAGCAVSSLWAADFEGTITNKEYGVFIKMHLAKDDIHIPGQEMLGECYGYLKKTTDSRVWIITNATVNGKTATLEMVNDYGSEDLMAELTLRPDGSYLLKQGKGSTIKVVANGKWQKLPSEMEFK